MPANAPVASLLTLTAQPTGTVVRIPVAVTPDTTIGYSLTGRTVTLSAADAASGVDSIQYRLDGSASWIGYTAPIALDDAGHTVEYRATDKAGNTSAVRTASVAALVPVGPSMLEAQGAARTVAPGGIVTGLGARVVDTTGAAVAGTTVTFTLTGPGTFAGGATSATATSNAAGVASAPAITSQAAGTITVTAPLAGSTSVALPTVTVAAPAPTLTADTAVSSPFVSGKVVLTVSATNTKTYLATVPAGEITVTASSGAEQRSIAVPYAAVAAG